MKKNLAFYPSIPNFIPNSEINAEDSNISKSPEDNNSKFVEKSETSFLLNESNHSTLQSTRNKCGSSVNLNLKKETNTNFINSNYIVSLNKEHFNFNSEEKNRSKKFYIHLKCGEIVKLENQIHLKNIKPIIKRLKEKQVNKEKIIETEHIIQSNAPQCEYPQNKLIEIQLPFPNSKVQNFSHINFICPEVMTKFIKSFWNIHHANKLCIQYIMCFLSRLVNSCTFRMNFNNSSINKNNSEELIQNKSHTEFFGIFKIIMEKHLSQYDNEIQYQTHSNIILFTHILLSKQQKFLTRKFQSSLSKKIKNHIQRRKKNKVVQLMLKKISLEIKALSLKTNDRKIYRNNIYKSKGKPLAFQRKNLYFPWLFYATKTSPIRFHIFCLVSNQKYEFRFYNSTSDWCDITDHNGSIYIAGGKDGGTYQNLCWKLNLSLISKAQGVALNPLQERKSNLTLISTPFDLFSLGGYQGQNLKSCERFRNLKSWMFIGSVSIARYSILATFIYPNYIYSFGNFNSNQIEILDIINPSKWEIIQVNDSNNRKPTLCFIMNEEELLLFGNSEEQNNIYKFKIKENKLLELGIYYPNYIPYHNKIKIFQGKMKAISRDPQKIVNFSMRKNSYNELKLTF